MSDNKIKTPREYMIMAIDVMKKSIPENRDDKKSPYVGAILVFPDGTIDSAYRGEFRDGDHAEYTLIDKKNRTKDLTDCWLFAFKVLIFMLMKKDVQFYVLIVCLKIRGGYR